MGLLDKIKEAVGIEEVEDYDEEVVEEPKKTEKPERPSFSQPEKRFVPQTPAAIAEPKKEAPKDFSKTMGRTTVDLKMIVVEPQGFEECPKLVDNLKAKKPVVINLENLETDVARKIFDFLSGATYALNGNVQKIANNIFVFAPANVDITYNSTQKVQTAESTVKSPWK